MPQHFAAVILAAGESSRMGRPKALLPYGGITFLEHIIAVVREAGADPVVVVLGHNPDEIRNCVDLTEVQVVVNENYKDGQLTSLQAGIRALETERVEGMLMCLVDHPVISPGLLRRLIQECADTGKDIVIPVHEGRKGHPVYVRRSLFPELLAAPLSEGARYVFRRHPDSTAFLKTSENGILTDIDTPEDFRNATKAALSDEDED